jgi:hypothetical protein
MLARAAFKAVRFPSSLSLLAPRFLSSSLSLHSSEERAEFREHVSAFAKDLLTPSLAEEIDRQVWR